MSISFTLLRTFHAVAEHGGFTAAANALHISQPTVTTQIKELEERYGVELLLRRSRRVELTDAGLALVEITRRMMSLRMEAHELMSSYGKLLTGELRLAAVGPYHATEMIALFRLAYPEVKISVLLGNSGVTLTNLIELRADVAVLAHAVDDPRVHTIVYRTQNVVVFVNRSHPWFGREAVSAAELAGQPFILREHGSTTRRTFEAAMQAAGVDISCVLEIGSREGVWKAVEQGLGIGVVADFEFVPHADLRTLRITDVPVTTEYRLACLRERRYSRTIAAFIDSVMSVEAARDC